MATIKVLNPVAKSVESRLDPPPRLRDLNGKRVGLYWNFKSGGDVALQRVGELLKQKYPEIRASSFIGDLGHMMRNCTPRQADEIAKQVDLVIGTTSD